LEGFVRRGCGGSGMMSREDIGNFNKIRKIEKMERFGIGEIRRLAV
jgi:hypothetical protein